MANGPTWDDVNDTAPSGAAPAAVWPKESSAEISARNAQPTQFEKDRANDSATPWADMAKGAGESLLDRTSEIGGAIRKFIPGGQKIIPAEGLAAEKSLATARTPGEQLGKTEGNVVQAAALPITEAAEGIAGSRFARPLIQPAARYLEETVLPGARAIPVVGRGIEAAEKAPTAVKAAVTGGASGAAYGTLPGLYHRNPGEMLHGAMEGGLIGAGVGAGAYGVRKVAALPTMQEEAQKLVPWEAFDTSKAKATPFEGVGAAPAAPSVRRTPGQIQPEVIGRAPQGLPQVENGEAALAGDQGTMRGVPKMLPAAPQPTGAKLMNQFENQVREGAGWKPLPQETPLRQIPQVAQQAQAQPLKFTTDSNGIRWAHSPDSPAPVSIPMRMTDPGEMEAYAREHLGLQSSFSGQRQQSGGSQSGTGTSMPAQRTWRNPAELNYPDIGAGKMVRGEPGGSKPSYLPEIVNEGVGRQYGAGPLEAGKPLSAQFGANPDSPPSRQVNLETKYPDKAIRQMAHANGERMVDAIGDDHELMKQVHDLTNPDVRQARINAGHNMGQTTVSNRKAMGAGAVSRQDSFDSLLDQGYTPREILNLAKRPIEGAAESKPGPQRAWTPLHKKSETGD